MSRFSGKNAIVTGGGSGIGAAVARRLASEGADVMVIGRRAEPLDRTVADIQAADGSAWSHVGDMSVVAQIQRAVDAASERWNTIDVLVNNAGTVEYGPVLEVPEESWDRVMATNLRGAFFLCQRVCRVMAVSGRGGAVVHVASVAGMGNDGPYASYCASKSALFAVNRSIAVELASEGIRSNAVTPGFVNTGFDEWEPHVKQHLQEGFKRAPMRREVEAHEVAAVVAFLASDDASGMTGSSVVVDGGMTADLYAYDSLPFDEAG